MGVPGSGPSGSDHFICAEKGSNKSVFKDGIRAAYCSGIDSFCRSCPQRVWVCDQPLVLGNGFSGRGDHCKGFAPYVCAKPKTETICSDSSHCLHGSGGSEQSIPQRKKYDAAVPFLDHSDSCVVCGERKLSYAFFSKARSFMYLRRNLDQRRLCLFSSGRKLYR